MNNQLKIVMEPEEIINCLKTETQLKEVCTKILSQRIIEKVAEQKDISVNTEEIEIEANRQRREKRLEKASDTIKWLDGQMLALLDWEVGIRNLLLKKKLASTLFGKEVEQFFTQNRSKFEQVILYQLIVKDEKLAQELYYQIEEGEISFYQAARLYDIDENPTFNYEIGWHIYQESWGKGYATEAALKIMDYGFYTLNLPALIAIIDPKNTASLKIAQKLGMISLGITDNYYNKGQELFYIKSECEKIFS